MDTTIIAILCMSACATVAARSLQARSLPARRLPARSLPARSLPSRSLQANIEEHVPNIHSEEAQPQGYGNYKSNVYENDKGIYKLLDTSFGERIDTHMSPIRVDDKDESFEHGVNVSHFKIKEENINLKTDKEILPRISDKDLNISESEIKNTVLNPCPSGEVLNSVGTCTKPQLTKKIYVYGPPKEMLNRNNFNISAPSPELQYNIILVKTRPEKIKGADPIIASAPRQKTIVYVLQKRKNPEKKIIKVPSPPRHTPEVFYANYGDDKESNLPYAHAQKTISSVIFNKNHEDETESKTISSTTTFNEHREDETESKTGTRNKLIPPSDVIFGARTDKGGAFSWYSEYSLK